MDDFRELVEYFYLVVNTPEAMEVEEATEKMLEELDADDLEQALGIWW